MSASTTLEDTPGPAPAMRRRHPMRLAAKMGAWVLGVPAVLLIVLYLVLLVTPLRLPFGGEAARALAQSIMPPTSKLDLGGMALALERGVWPVLQFSPVLMTDAKTGAKVKMDALEIGFSPIRALVGQPGATITIVRPHIQIVQDLFGPRTTSFELVADEQGGTTARVLEGEDAFPSVDISASGVDVQGGSVPLQLRSDNDWLIYNLEASEKGVADIVEQAQQGRFSKLTIKDGTVEMIDAVYGRMRQFNGVNLEIGPTPGGEDTRGTFSAALGGRTMMGSLSRTLDDKGGSRLEADIANIDFAAVAPFVDDAESIAALRGAGALSIDVHFAPETGKLVDGAFKIDLTGLDMRIEDEFFPVASSIMDVTWSPKDARFELHEAALQIGQSSARVSGTFALGLDAEFGPTIGMMIKAREVRVHPNDMAAPAEPFDSVEFSGWSAPLYGATGIDRLVAKKGAAIVESAGRIDILKAGMALDMTIVGQGVSADDLKRLWPYMLGTESRDWFVANVSDGMVTRARLKFKFPVGSLEVGGEDKPISPEAMQIDMVGTGVVVKPVPEMADIAIDGETRLQLSGPNLTVSAGGGAIATTTGPIAVRNPAVIMDNSNPAESILEISGDVSAGIPSLLALAKEQQPEMLAQASLPLDLAALSGQIDLGLVATIKLPDEASGAPLDLDYVVNGNVANFASTQAIQERTIGNGQLSFSASQDGYQVQGTADIDGMEAQLEIAGTPETQPAFRLASKVEVKDLAAMGFDASPFMSGQVGFVAQPLPDGSLQIAVDLKEAALTIGDLGLSKAAGVPGTLQTIVKQTDGVTELFGIDLAFDTVKLKGGLKFDAEAGLQSAEFIDFGLSEGDGAQLKLAPIDGGYSVQVRGTQLDLKPMLKRFFSLDEGTGGVQTTEFDQTLVLDVELDRALGYYATTAFNLDLDLSLKGSDMRRARLTAQFGDDNAISVTTNPAPKGRTMTVAFSDAGTILRLLGVYSQLAGGEGNLVMTTDSEAGAEFGQLRMRGFSIVDEANVAQVLGNHADSRAVIARGNRLDFDRGMVNFVRRSDRVEVTNAVLTGDTVGGTMRGFIYTDQRQYDLAGTYVPLFGLNSAFQKIPLLGPLLGGRDGEGLVGVTFAVKGPLAKPDFRINPLSALVPGAFRELFEFRSREQPRVD
ncbi:AsmA-like C-terminal domain-containing protein [Devosia sp. 1566]|uniref:AsmA-like C-terminal domain-containing protein n=1 Tax=Devosia sp. 1566 TaxID=2499144 RepID=UPI000FD7439E|nr:AsmA-like C-terminal domain-containing protein [Devosia sp. 1566]